jgi:thiamine-phosphate pyrophosphorylase
VGLDYIPELKRRLTIPFTVMGGIKAHHIPQLLEYGAETIAMVTEITQAPDITKRTQELLNFFLR